MPIKTERSRPIDADQFKPRPPEVSLLERHDWRHPGTRGLRAAAGQDPRPTRRRAHARTACRTCVGGACGRVVARDALTGLGIGVSGGGTHLGRATALALAAAGAEVVVLGR